MDLITKLKIGSLEAYGYKPTKVSRPICVQDCESQFFRFRPTCIHVHPRLWEFPQIGNLMGKAK